MYLQEPKVEYVPLKQFDITSVSWCNWSAPFDHAETPGVETCTGLAPMHNCDRYGYPMNLTSNGDCWINGQATEADE